MSILSDREPPTHEMPLMGGGSADVESCRSCGGVVAREQRYCLSCGSRRSERRVPFAETLGSSAELPPQPAKPKAGGVITPGIAAAIVCASVLFLGTGVLVGRSGNSGTVTSAAAPQIVTVPAGGDGSGETVASDGGGDAGAGGKKKKTVKVKSAAAAPVLTGEAKKKLDAAMNCSTPEACQEASKKIPNELATPGKPPPVDNKAPAGGAKGQVFQ